MAERCKKEKGIFSGLLAGGKFAIMLEALLQPLSWVEVLYEKGMAAVGSGGDR